MMGCGICHARRDFHNENARARLAPQQSVPTTTRSPVLIAWYHRNTACRTGDTLLVAYAFIYDFQNFHETIFRSSYIMEK